MKLVLAEKPSVAMSLSKVIGANQRGDGYMDLLAGKQYSALVEHSMLNAPNVRCYAAERISQWKDVMTNSLYDSQVQVAVEIWRYNPRKLSTRNTVDELSLALALREDADERVEEAVKEMLNELWRKIKWQYGDYR